MAKYDWINYLDGSDEECLNLSHSVGFRGVNRHDDVMLLQAFFWYLSERGARGPATIGLGGDYDVPKVSGVLDNETYAAISQFQIEWKRSLMMRVFDGRIDEAHYHDRKLHRTGLHVMSITLLHLLASDTALMNGDNSYLRVIEKRYPQLAHSLDMSLIDDKYDGN